MNHLFIEAGHQKRIAGYSAFDRRLAPGSAPTGRLSPLPQIIRLAEPYARLRLARYRICSVVRRSFVTAHCQQSAECTIIGDDTQKLANRFDSPDVVLEGDGLQFV